MARSGSMVSQSVPENSEPVQSSRHCHTLTKISPQNISFISHLPLKMSGWHGVV